MSITLSHRSEESRYERCDAVDFARFVLRIPLNADMRIDHNSICIDVVRHTKTNMTPRAVVVIKKDKKGTMMLREGNY